jgi:flagellar biosynthesis activator protein FlaF
VTALNLAQKAYSKAANPTRTDRGAEYEIFAQITRQLVSTAAARKKSFPAFAAALHENTRLWTTIAADVADPGNRLNASLRAQLFYLFEFTAQHTPKVLANKADVDVLIEINTSIMRGLRGRGDDA